MTRIKLHFPPINAVIIGKGRGKGQSDARYHDIRVGQRHLVMKDEDEDLYDWKFRTSQLRTINDDD